MEGFKRGSFGRRTQKRSPFILLRLWVYETSGQSDAIFGRSAYCDMQKGIPSRTPKNEGIGRDFGLQRTITNTNSWGFVAVKRAAEQ